MAEWEDSDSAQDLLDQQSEEASTYNEDKTSAVSAGYDGQMSDTGLDDFSLDDALDTISGEDSSEESHQEGGSYLPGDDNVIKASGVLGGYVLGAAPEYDLE